MARVPGILKGDRTAPSSDGEQTYWNGETTPARRVRVTIADHSYPAYWARELVGQERDAVEVTYNGEVFYLDDEAHEHGTTDGAGWRKVTTGHGSPRYGHRELEVEPGSVVDRP